MSKPYKINFYHREDNYGHEYYHEIQSETVDSDVYLYFEAYDMCECPEDATLSRDLFDGEDYIEAIKLGMKLANLGYDEIEVKDFMID